MDYIQLRSLLSSCIHSKSLHKAKLIHQKLLASGLQHSIPLSKNLISLYISCRSTDAAESVFEALGNPLDITLWNGVLAAYTNNSMFTHALHLFDKLLLLPGIAPDSYTYPSVLKACGGLGRVACGRKLHSLLLKNGCVSDVVVGSSVLGMYGKCGMFKDAVQVFDEMSVRDVPCWNAVISCYFQDGQLGKALEVFDRMVRAGLVPNSTSLATAISACGRLLDLDKGKEIHLELVRNGVVVDDFVGSALVDMYGKCGRLDLAKDIFYRCQPKSVSLWNSMISAHSWKGDTESCMELFVRMTEEQVKPTATTLCSLLMVCSRSAHLRHGKFVHGYITRHQIGADIYVNCSLMDLYFKCGHVKSAEYIFAEVSEPFTAVSWNLMISGYATAGLYFESLEFFAAMTKAGVKPDAVTFTSVLPVCSQLAVLEKGKQIHQCITEHNLESNEMVMGALLDMYSKCGAIGEARNVFNRLPDRDCVTWTSMITAYGSHGKGHEAINLFCEMEKSRAKPDSVTFLAVMSACSHSGLLEEGCYYFNHMVSKYGISPSLAHYSCLIDILGRAGRLYEAYNLLQSNPSTKDDVQLLSTLFSACRLHKNIELGEEIGNLLIDKDPNDPSTYVTLSHMYAYENKWDEARELKVKIRRQSLQKSPGYSWIEIHKEIQHFFAGSNKSHHPDNNLVMECLAVLNSHMEMEASPEVEQFTIICCY
uniref:Chlororespiratory reduction 21 n=1 Tax=Kalanchoe fedtschenkoi TaxID=63787 RepID=A0A7N0TI04_KALFE